MVDIFAAILAMTIVVVEIDAIEVVNIQGVRLGKIIKLTPMKTR